MALQIQESTLREFFDRAGTLARGSGFLARFLIAWPRSTQGTRFYSDPPDGWHALDEFERRITSILDAPVPINDDGDLTPVMLTLDADAKAAWVAFHDAIEAEMADGGELREVRDVASKTADNAARLAALLQVFEHGLHGGAIGLDAFERASKITAWHLSESRRFFGELALPPELAAAARLDGWLLDYCRREQASEISTRDAQRLGPLRTSEALSAALAVLAELDRARIVTEGRRKTIKINPALQGGTHHGLA